MQLTKSGFARQVEILRPALLRAAVHMRFCSSEDAEDLVSQTVYQALRLLPEYRAETGQEGLARWLRGILRMVILDEMKRGQREVETVSLESEIFTAAAEVTAASASPILKALRTLPDHQRGLVRDWLQGDTQAAIARTYRLHRNTVGRRLEQAFQSLRVALPDANAFERAENLLTFCSRVSIYRKPRGVWPSWFRRHPPELHFQRYTAARRRQAAPARDTEPIR